MRLEKIGVTVAFKFPADAYRRAAEALARYGKSHREAIQAVQETAREFRRGRIARPGCYCCGEPWSNGGCVRGWRCGCDHFNWRRRCHKCPEHCRCPEGVMSFEQLVAQTEKLMKEAEIDGIQ
jgi:hypothetical protein